MKVRIFITVTFLMLGFTSIEAQSRMTKETKVVLVINEKTNLITNIVTQASSGVEREMTKKYPNSIFYSGLLKGGYKNDKYGLGPIIGSLITIYTNRQLFADDRLGNFDRMGNFKKGDVVKLGRNQGEIISKLQVEMTIKIL